jgi:signal transduction histidine kinase
VNPPLGTHPGSPPWESLRERLLERVEGMRASGDESGAAVLRALVETWWGEQQRWTEALREALRANHEINNALVGVSGNAQLLLLSPTGQQPAVRERLQIILREAGRVERAARELQETRARLGLNASPPRAGEEHGDPAPRPRG